MNLRNFMLSSLQLGLLIVSLGAQVLMAEKIGPGQQLDSYFAAFGFAMAWVGSVAVSGTYLLPARILTDGHTTDQKSAIAGNGVMAIAAVGFCVAIISMVVFLAGVATREQTYPGDYDKLLIGLSWTVALTSVLAAAWGAVGNAYGRVVGALALGILPQAFMVSYLLVAKEPSVVSMLGAQVVGISVQTVCLARIYRMHWSLIGLDLRVVVRIAGNLPVAAAGALCFSAYAAVDAWLAPGFGEGVLSHQALAQRLVIAFSAVLSAGPFMLATSIVSTMLDAGRAQDVWTYTFKSGIVLTGLCLVGSALTPWIGEWVISMLFQRGSFSASDTHAVSSVLTVLLMGAGPMLASAVAFRVLHAMGHGLQVAILSVSWLFAYTIVAKFISIWFGALSLAIAYVVAWSTVVLATFFCVAHALRERAKPVKN
jgi:peptidoglycan biosynthesis protein MviN/MurJ (putative lipid II flippase)